MLPSTFSENFVVPMFFPTKKRKAPPSLKVPCLLGWAHLGLNQGPPDYEREKFLFHQFSFVCIYEKIRYLDDFCFETKWYLFTFI